jgi:pseudouridine synthase
VERLQKILSRAGVASRRAAEQLMTDGRVSVNGAVVRELGTKADASRDDIRVDGRRVKPAARYRYLLLNKPRGYVTTRSDPQGRPTVLDLLTGVHEYVYPVGRLDFDSEGLLLLTNDGDLTSRLTHPRHGVARVYEVRVSGLPDAHDLKRLATGVTVEGRPTAPADVRVLSTNRHEDRATVQITLFEGRNRQVRKMFETIGHSVAELRRVAIGPLRDSRLKPGHWRDLDRDEVRKLREAADRESARDDSRRPDRGRLHRPGPQSR